MALLAVVLLVQFWFFCKVVWYSMHPPSSTPIMRAAMSELRKTQPDATLRYEWVDYQSISTNLKRAVLAAEDTTFMQHKGVDWKAIRSAWEHNRQLAAQLAAAEESGETVRGTFRGGSTI